MAATSASRRWARRALTTGAVAAVGLLALAIPASAHTPHATADCVNNVPAVTVWAAAYELNGDNKTPNSIKIFVDGSAKPDKEFSFGVNYNLEKKPLPFDKIDATVEHTFKVVVMAWNDDSFDPKPVNYSQVINLKTKACKEKESTPAPPPVNNPPAQQPPAPQPAPAPVNVGASGQLASTGVSIAIPIAIGALLLVGGAGLLLLMRRRGKA